MAGAWMSLIIYFSMRKNSCKKGKGNRPSFSERQTQRLSVAAGDLNFSEKPDASVGPVILDRALGETQRLGDFNIGHADKVTQLDHFGLDRVRSGQPV